VKNNLRKLESGEYIDKEYFKQQFEKRYENSTKRIRFESLREFMEELLIEHLLEEEYRAVQVDFYLKAQQHVEKSQTQ
jgi:hypothetical protein